MTDIRDRAIRAAESVSWGGALSLRQTARRIQDAALRVVDARALQRLELIDRAVDRDIADLERAEVAAIADAPKDRRVTPFPDMGAMFAATFGAGLAIGAGRVVSRTRAGEMAFVGPAVLVLAVVAFALLLVGAYFARREQSASTNRALFLWFTSALALVAIVGVSVRLVVEEATVAGAAAVAAMAVVLLLALPLAIAATRRRQPVDEDAPRPHPGRRERYALLSASETAQDRAHDELDALDPAARTAFADAYRAGLDAALERGALARPVAKRLHALDWAAARYDVE